MVVGIMALSTAACFHTVGPGTTSYVTTAGEDRVTVIDAARHQIAGRIPAPGTPLGVIPLPNGKDLAVARFQAGGLARYARSGPAPWAETVAPAREPR